MMPFFPVIPILAIIFQLMLITHMHAVSLTALIVGPGWVIAGFIIYHLYSKKHVLASDDEIQLLESEEVRETESPETDIHNMMVAVSNPENAMSLIRNTYRICQAKNARIELSHMVEVPKQIPLADAENLMLEGKEAIFEMLMYLKPIFSVSTSIYYCRNAARGVLNAIRTKRISTLILGWTGESMQKPEFSLGRVIDPVIERSPSNVIVFKGITDKNYQNILVPISGGPNSKFALELANILTEVPDSRITVLYVDTGRGKFNAELQTREWLRDLKIDNSKVKVEIVYHTNVEKTITSMAADYDMMIIGATGKKLLQHFVEISLPERIAIKCDTPVAMVKATTGLRSWVKRWI